MNRLLHWFLVFVGMLLITTPALAADAGLGKAIGGVGLATALAIGLAALGGGLGQGRAAAASLEGIARNPEARGEVFVPLIISLALIESLVIYALIIAFMLLGQLGSLVELAGK